MNIAIFADVHGRILLAFKLVERYQRETGEHIDLIIQCGDMGIYPDVTKLDKATIRHAETDGTELGFHEHFAERNAEAEEVLLKLDCNLVCVRGNHEDHEYLDRLEADSASSIFPVDVYERVYVMQTGRLHEFSLAGDRLRVLGIGRVGPPDGESDARKPKYIQQYESDHVLSCRDSEFDILITHDARRDFIRSGIGMEEISLVLDQHKPAYHFFGHTGEPFQRLVDHNGVTICSKLSDFEWDEVDRGKRLKSGCFGILRWRGADDNQFEVVDAAWLKEYTPHTWRYI